jgi:hypothetical protein
MLLLVNRGYGYLNHKIRDSYCNYPNIYTLKLVGMEGSFFLISPRRGGMMAGPLVADVFWRETDPFQSIKTSAAYLI